MKNKEIESAYVNPKKHSDKEINTYITIMIYNIKISMQFWNNNNDLQPQAKNCS